MTVKEVETCPWCSRFICNNCKDEYSGLCIDCTTILLKEVSKVSMAKILRRMEEKVSKLGVAEVLREIREGEEQEEFDRALEEYAEMMEDYESCLEGVSPNEFCPNCGSGDYDVIPTFETKTQSRYKCNECGFEWVVGK
jgi:hypothetical protein